MVISSVWPITFQDALDAEKRLRPYLPPTPLRNYRPLDEAAGCGVKIFVKHENHNPTNSFKARNALSVLTLLSEKEKQRGVVAASRGNHGQGLAWAGQLLRIPVTICVPLGNNPEKNEAIRGFGAQLIEQGNDYDEATRVADKLVQSRGLRLVHSTNDPLVIAGAATLGLEIFQQEKNLDALFVSVGGGSQAVGALIAASALSPNMKVIGVQAQGASAAYDSWHAGKPLLKTSANTFADGLATRTVYDLTFNALQEGLHDFITVSEAEIAAAIRLYLRTTHNLAEGAGAAALAGLIKLTHRFQGQSLGVVLSGSNIDQDTLRRVINCQI